MKKKVFVWNIVLNKDIKGFENICFYVLIFIGLKFVLIWYN